MLLVSLKSTVRYFMLCHCLEQAKLEKHDGSVSGSTAYNPIKVDSANSEHNTLEIVFNESDNTTYCKRTL